ncbi:hypothetical protein ACRZ5S_06725 [Vibrio scophthalmi]|uniref:hypothetical protein n=1 Tax=Vibrio scophthalmi TaxID=45658 RepID=UPI003EBA999C
MCRLVKLNFLALVVAASVLPFSFDAEARRIYSVNQGMKLDGFDPSFFDGQWVANEPKDMNHRGAIAMHKYSLDKVVNKTPQFYIFEGIDATDIHDRLKFAKDKTWSGESSAYNQVIFDLTAAGKRLEEIFVYNENYKQYEEADDSEKLKLRTKFRNQSYRNYLESSGEPLKVSPKFEDRYLSIYGYRYSSVLGSEGLIWVNKKNIHKWPHGESDDYSNVFDWYEERFGFDVLNETDLAFLNGQDDMVFIDVIDSNFFVMYGTSGMSLTGFRRVVDQTKLVEVDYRDKYLQWKRQKYNPK